MGDTDVLVTGDLMWHQPAESHLGELIMGKNGTKMVQEL